MSIKLFLRQRMLPCGSWIPIFAATLWPRALRSHPHTLPIKRENRPGVPRCSNTAVTSSISPDRNATLSIRHTPACFLRAKWAEPCVGRSFRFATVHFYNEKPIQRMSFPPLERQVVPKTHHKSHRMAFTLQSLA